MRIRNKLTTAMVGALAAAMFAVAIPGSALADTGETTATEAAAALDKADAKDDALIAAAVPSTTDGDSAAQTATVDIPTDPKAGVKLTKDGRTLTIGVPEAKRSGKGQKTRKGAVAYSGRDGSANAVVPTADGVQFLTTIESRKGATKFDYPVAVPEGGKIELAAAGGGVIIFDAERKPLGVVAAPWAKDANGNSVKSWFTTDGKTLTQHVQHRVKGTAYPVVADPWFQWQWYGGVFYFSKGETNWIVNSGQIAIMGLFGAWTGGFGAVVIGIIIETAKSALRSNQCLAVVVPWGTPFFHRC